MSGVDDEVARRHRAAEKGHALPPLREGEVPRFPAENRNALREAVGDYARIPEEEKPEVRRFLTRRAVELDALDVLPDDWHVQQTQVRQYTDGNQI
jgi:hypothetical protein